MSTYPQLVYHSVFATKNREKTIDLLRKKRLLAFIHQLLTNKNGHRYRINRVEDHLQILTHFHLSVSLASLVKDIKLESGDFIMREGVFPNCKGWQDGYGAFTESVKSKERFIQYIKNQEKHLQKVSFLDGYQAL